MELSKEFACCADEVWRLQNLKDPDCVLFRRWCDEGGQLNGDGEQTTRQGTYCATPSGVFLGSCNHRDPARVAEMLRGALKKWKEIDKKARLLDYDPATKLKDITRAEKNYPEGGMALKVHSRDLNREDLPRSDWRSYALNLDFAWFRKDEMLRLIPKDPFTKDTTWDLPEDLVRRTMRLHVRDNVRGQTNSYTDEQVEKAAIKAKVEKLRKGIVHFSMEGEVKLKAGQREIEAKIRGKAQWNTLKSKFDEFELVVAGTRQGRTQFNAREDDQGKAGIGWVFTLAGDKPVDKIAPAEFGQYGWR